MSFGEREQTYAIAYLLTRIMSMLEGCPPLESALKIGTIVLVYTRCMHGLSFIKAFCWLDNTKPAFPVDDPIL